MLKAIAASCRAEGRAARRVRGLMTVLAIVAAGAGAPPTDRPMPKTRRAGERPAGRAVRGCQVALAPLDVAEPFESEFVSGVLATYRARDGASVVRIEPTVATQWTDGSPDEGLRLPVQATWSARLIVKQPGTYRFSAYLDGEVVVRVGQQVVLRGRREGGWLAGGPVQLQFGDRPLDVRFEQRGATARLQLFWASEHFPLEPLPAHQLYVEDVPAEVMLRERGRELFEALGCGRCHVEGLGTEPPGPDLRSVSLRDRAALIAQLTRISHDSAAAGSAAGSMPRFDLPRRDVRDIVAYLIEQGRPRALLAVPSAVKGGARGTARQGDRPEPDGRQLVLTVGCLACHSVPLGDRRVGRHGPGSAGDLAERAAVRSPEWLFTWLKEPQRLRPQHRMPVFPLTDSERRAIVHALKAWRPATAPARRGTTEEGDVERGRSLVRQLRCGACHRLNEQPPLEPALGPEKAEWEQGCAVARKAGEARPSHQPRYALDSQQVAALRAYWRSLRGDVQRLSSFERGRRLLAARGCVRCHPRDTGPGLAEVVRAIVRAEPALTQSAAVMIPPRLTAVGDKLRDAALREAFSHQRQPRRLPWLLPRMPRFDHSPSQADALSRYLIGHDRIPDDPPPELIAFGEAPANAVHSRGDEAARPAGDQLLVVGRALVGAGGFSCIACHQVGDYVPKNTAPGTRGSDLLGLRARMRRPFFLRWTRSPLRIAPGVEMPSYTRPIPGVLDGTIQTQLSVLWEALNAPQFRAPPHPSAVEQLVVVPPDGPPRVIRDVFALPQWEQGEAVARSFAVGFGNGHDVLFDLDELCVRQWTFGEFAQQRTVGKSWYWDLAGVPVVRGWPVRPDWGLVLTGSQSRAGTPRRRDGDGAASGERDRGGGLTDPVRHFGTRTRLLEYATEPRAVRMRYSVSFRIGQELRHLIAEEWWQPVESEEGPTEGRSGWSRTVVVRGAAVGEQIAVRVPRWKTPGAAGVRVVGASSVELNSGSSTAADLPQWVVAERAGDEWRFRIEYTSPLRRPTTSVKLPEPARETVQRLVTTPGFEATRLPLPVSIMPTALVWTEKGQLAFTSLKGGVWIASDADGDGLEDSLQAFEQGLAAPYGLLPDGPGRLLVAHKPEVLRLIDTDGDGRADRREVVASGWGYTDDYHDWTTGLIRDPAGNLYVGTGSDYAQKGRRAPEHQRWRGKVLRITPQGDVVPVGHGFRYPIGLAIDASERVFVSDNQGVQNCFNEINWLQSGGFYGVPALADRPGRRALPPAIQVPHPWTRSVNGLFFLPQDFAIPAFAGHGIGCEYNGRFLVRFTYHEVDGQLQGAVYAFTGPGDREPTFQGPLCGGVSPEGTIYVGNIHDSGWLGGRNVGSIVRMMPDPDSVPNGIREIRAEPNGFRISFIRPVDRERLRDASRYLVVGYTRVWRGGYATPDSGRYRLSVRKAEPDDGGTEVHLQCGPLRAGYVYEISCGALAEQEAFFPAVGYYTMNRVPRAR